MFWSLEPLVAGLTKQLESAEKTSTVQCVAANRQPLNLQKTEAEGEAFVKNGKFVNQQHMKGFILSAGVSFR